MRNLGLGFGLGLMVATVGGCSSTPTATDDMNTECGVGSTCDMGVTTPPDMSFMPTLGGTKVVSTASQVITINSDGYIVYFAGKTGISAVKLDGTDGSVKIPNATWVSPGKKALFGWVLPSNDQGVGELWSWTAGATAATKLTDSSTHPSSTKTLSAVSSSDDGTKALFSTNATATTTDLALGNVSGSGTPIPVLTGIPTDGDCQLTMAYAGGKFIVGYCTALPAVDGGVAPSTIIAVDATTGVKTTLFTSARNFFSVDSAATKVVGIDDNQHLMWVPISGTGVVTVGSEVVDSELAVLNAAGTNLVWVDNSENLKRLDVSQAGQSVVTLQTGVKVLLKISPDETHAFITKNQDTTNSSNDLYLVSLTTNTSTTLVSTPTGATYGDGFSLDSSRAFYYTDVANEVGTLHSVPVAGGTDVTIGTGVWTEYAGAGDRIIFSDNYKSGTTAVDIKYIPSAGGTATLIATGAKDDPVTTNIRPLVTTDGTKLVYPYAGKPAADDGIYVFTLP